MLSLQNILQNVSLFQDFYNRIQEFVDNLLHFHKAALLYNVTSLLALTSKMQYRTGMCISAPADCNLRGFHIKSDLLKTIQISIHFFSIKSSKMDFIFSPAFYLIMWLMTSAKNFEKIAILKKWQLVFFWGDKTYFGEKKA